MDSKEVKKERIRNQIICAAQNYSSALAGKTFLYVYGANHFEILFPTDRFMHLAGVDSFLSARSFYDYAKKGILTNKQFFFQKHTYNEAKEKLPCLNRLSELTTNLVCIVMDLATITLTYKIGLTNLEFTLGLTEHTDAKGCKIDNLFIPRTLRVNDRSIEKSANADFVDFIFVRDASKAKYSAVTYSNPTQKLPPSVQALIEPDIYDQFISNANDSVCYDEPATQINDEQPKDVKTE